MLKKNLSFFFLFLCISYSYCLFADTNKITTKTFNCTQGNRLIQGVQSVDTIINFVDLYHHENLKEFGKHLSIPIINGLSNQSHPCQIMSDIFTFEEVKGNISGKNIAWLGDGNNNMSNSLIEAASRFGFKLKIGCPDKYKPNKKVMSWAKKNKADILVTKNPNEAAKDADCVMTDKWVSMNDKVNKKAKKNSLKKYQVNKKLMKLAKSDAIFMHCLPVGRGEEVTDEIIDGKQSVVWRQALNRVHAQKSIINWCLN